MPGSWRGCQERWGKEAERGAWLDGASVPLHGWRGQGARGALRHALCPHHLVAETLHFIAWLCDSAIQGDASQGGGESSGRPGSERRASGCDRGREIWPSVTCVCFHVFLSSCSLKKWLCLKLRLKCSPSPRPTCVAWGISSQAVSSSVLLLQGLFASMQTTTLRSRKIFGVTSPSSLFPRIHSSTPHSLQLLGL